MTPLQEDWVRCREWIRAAVEPTGLYQIGDVEQAIASGEMHFWPGKDCAAVTEFIFYPNCKALNIFAGGGRKGEALKELTCEMEPALELWRAQAPARRSLPSASSRLGCLLGRRWATGISGQS